MSVELIANALAAALSAGVAAGSTDVAKKAISDAYDALKSLLRRRFGEGHEVSQSVEKLEAKPDSPARKQLLTEELAATTAGEDPEILSAAQSLLDLVSAMPQGESHVQSARGTGIAQADRGAAASVTISGNINSLDSKSND